MQIDELIHEIAQVVDTETWIKLQPVFQKFKHGASNHICDTWIKNPGKNPFHCLEERPLIEVRFTSFERRIEYPNEFDWSFRFNRGSGPGGKIRDFRIVNDRV